jgi:hypothetical protein
MPDRRGARVYPLHVVGGQTGAYPVDSPSGVLAPGTRVDVLIDRRWQPAIVQPRGTAESSLVCVQLIEAP